MLLLNVTERFLPAMPPVIMQSERPKYKATSPRHKLRTKVHEL